MHPPPPSQGAGRSSPTPTPNPSLAFAPPSSTPSPGSSTALAMQPRRCRRRRSREGRPRGKALEASRSFGGPSSRGAGERRAVKILEMGGGGRGGFARCTTRFLGAFFSFVTRALSPPVVGDGCQNGKAERPLHSAPWDFFAILESGLVFKWFGGDLCIVHFFFQKWCWVYVFCPLFIIHEVVCPFNRCLWTKQ